MSSEFGNWNELAQLWHRHTAAVCASEVERHAARQRRQMLVLAVAEAACMSLSLVAAVWIAVQTAMVILTGITMVFFALCAFLQHRMRREPPPSGGHDLLSSLEHSVERERWNLSQLGIGRAVIFLTLSGIVLVAADHLAHLATTPAARLWALLGVTFFVLMILVLNLLLTWRARRRKARMESFAARLAGGPEFRGGARP
jgi:hypothetical protein